jgi:aminoglycoside 3-N-acetyltransferase
MHKCDLKSLELFLLNFKIPKYSTIIIHSSLFKFGILDGGIEAFYNMLRKVFDESYTILMPTFTFSFSNSRYWDCVETKSESGALTEFMRLKLPKNRTINPFHSICIDGPLKEYFLNDVSYSSFGQNSIFEKLLKVNAYNLSLGIEFVGGATFCHYAEEFLQVPYRFYKPFPGIVIDSNKNNVEIDFMMYVRVIENDYYFDNNWEIFWKDLLEKKLVNYYKFNKIAPVLLMNIVDTHDFLVNKIINDPFYIAKKIKIKKDERKN